MAWIGADDPLRVPACEVRAIRLADGNLERDGAFVANFMKRGSRAILVLGMHRSGTSAVTGALRLCGVELGTELMQPGSDNPKGFWEHAGVVAIHERLLAALERSWNDPRPLPADWLQSEATGAAAGELVRGERVRFTAMVKPYVKGYFGERIDDRMQRPSGIDYALAYPRDVIRLDKPTATPVCRLSRYRRS